MIYAVFYAKEEENNLTYLAAFPLKTKKEFLDHTNPYIPVINKMLKVDKSVETPLPSVYQAGQWVYSPSGLPISILTGKLAADKVLSKKDK